MFLAGRSFDTRPHKRLSKPKRKRKYPLSRFRETIVQILEAMFLWCVVWSFGATLIEKPHLQQRHAFDAFLKRIARLELVDGSAIPATQLPKGCLFDFNFDLSTFEWKPWDAYLTPYQPPESRRFSEIFVPTEDTLRRDLESYKTRTCVRSTWLLDVVMQQKQPCLLVGDPGTAKTVTIQKYLHSLSNSKATLLNINFSSRTRAGDIQCAIEERIEKRTKVKEIDIETDLSFTKTGHFWTCVRKDVADFRR